jgi:hypothetical protein
MLATTRQVPIAKRYLPRPGDGPASKREAALRAEIVHLNTRLLSIEREHQITVERIAQMQQQLDELVRLMKKLAP